MNDEVELDDIDESRNIISQLKEIHHYSKTNIEKLSEFWLLMEGELKQKGYGERMEQLINQQTGLHEDLEALINDYEIECNRVENEAD